MVVLVAVASAAGPMVVVSVGGPLVVVDGLIAAVEYAAVLVVSAAG